MTGFRAYADDLADAVADQLGVPCTSIWSGNVEPNTAHIRWGSDGGPWFDRTDGTFCAPVVSATVVVMANTFDYSAAIEWLERRAVDLLGLGLTNRTMPRTGLLVPPIVSAGEIGRLDEDHNILALSAEFAPTPINVP